MSPHTIEIVILDDDPLILQALIVALPPEYRAHAFLKINEAEQAIERLDPDLAILDLNLQGSTGAELLKAWKQKFPETDILCCSGEPSILRAIECLRLGASDYIIKPFRKDDLSLVVQRALEKRFLRKRVEKLTPLIVPRPITFIGESKPMRDVTDKVRVLKGQDHLNILILGESGTGKEVVARLLYQQESEGQRPFVVVNMPAIPATLMEAELFGVEKGSYTDAKISRPGKFELADGGDIFLDEIGDLPIDTQAKILRVLQEKQVERIGALRPRRTNFRAISATNRPLADLMSDGRFRGDLIYRLSDMVLWMPPLREHKEDIPALAVHFLEKFSHSRTKPRLTDRAIQRLMDYDWPGNVRQLESTLKRALVFSPGPVIDNVEIFDPMMFNPERVREAGTEGGFEARREHFERGIIETALRKHGGDRTAAMTELRLSRATFYRKLSQLKIATD